MAEMIHDAIVAQIKRQLRKVKRKKADGTMGAAFLDADIRTDAMFNLDDFPMAVAGHPLAVIYQDGHAERKAVNRQQDTIRLSRYDPADGRILRIDGLFECIVRYVVEVRTTLNDPFYGSYDYELVNAFDMRAFVWKALNILESDEATKLADYEVAVPQLVEPPIRTIIEVEKPMGDDGGNSLRAKIPVAAAWELPLTYTYMIYRASYTKTSSKLVLSSTEVRDE